MHPKDCCLRVQLNERVMGTGRRPIKLSLQLGFTCSLAYAVRQDGSMSQITLWHLNDGFIKHGIKICILLSNK